MAKTPPVEAAHYKEMPFLVKSLQRCTCRSSGELLPVKNKKYIFIAGMFAIFYVLLAAATSRDVIITSVVIITSATSQRRHKETTRTSAEAVLLVQVKKPSVFLLTARKLELVRGTI